MDKLYRLIIPCIPDRFSMSAIYPVPENINYEESENWKSENWGTATDVRDVVVKLYSDTTLIITYTTLEFSNKEFIQYLNVRFNTLNYKLTYIFPNHESAGIMILEKDVWQDDTPMCYNSYVFFRNKDEEKYTLSSYNEEEYESYESFSEYIVISCIEEEWEEAFAEKNFCADNVRNWDKFVQFKKDLNKGNISFERRRKLFIDPYLGINDEPYIEKLNDITIYKAVSMWLNNKPLALKRYGPISNWDTSEVNVMSCLFLGADFNESIDNWDVSNVTDMHKMFMESTFNQKLDNWNVSRVINFREMFAFNRVFNQKIGCWNVHNARNMKSMFEKSESFNQSLKKWNYINFKDENFWIHGKDDIEFSSGDLPF